MDVVRSGRIDTVQVIYNLFDQSAERELFRACEEMGVGVIARVPFDEGALTGAITADTRFSKKDWRNRYFRGDRKERVQEHVQQLSRLLGDEVQTLAELALRFCLQPRVVFCRNPGNEVHFPRSCQPCGFRSAAAQSQSDDGIEAARLGEELLFLTLLVVLSNPPVDGSSRIVDAFRVNFQLSQLRHLLEQVEAVLVVFEQRVAELENRLFGLRSPVGEPFDRLLGEADLDPMLFQKLALELLHLELDHAQSVHGWTLE